MSDTHLGNSSNSAKTSQIPHLPRTATRRGTSLAPTHSKPHSMSPHSIRSLVYACCTGKRPTLSSRRVPPTPTSETTFYPTWNCDFPPNRLQQLCPRTICRAAVMLGNLTCALFTPKDGNSCLSVIWPAHAGIELSVRGEQPDESAASAGMDFEMLHNPNTSRMMSAYRFVRERPSPDRKAIAAHHRDGARP